MRQRHASTPCVNDGRQLLGKGKEYGYEQIKEAHRKRLGAESPVNLFMLTNELGKQPQRPSENVEAFITRLENVRSHASKTGTPPFVANAHQQQQQQQASARQVPLNRQPGRGGPPIQGRGGQRGGWWQLQPHIPHQQGYRQLVGRLLLQRQRRGALTAHADERVEQERPAIVPVRHNQAIRKQRDMSKVARARRSRRRPTMPSRSST